MDYTETLKQMLNNNSGTEEILKEANRIKEKYALDFNPYFELLDLMRDAYLKGYQDGCDMAQAVYKVGKYDKLFK
jgi:hypothetical protein